MLNTRMSVPSLYRPWIRNSRANSDISEEMYENTHGTRALQWQQYGPPGLLVGIGLVERRFVSAFLDSFMPIGKPGNQAVPKFVSSAASNRRWLIVYAGELVKVGIILVRPTDVCGPRLT